MNLTPRFLHIHDVGQGSKWNLWLCFDYCFVVSCLFFFSHQIEIVCVGICVIKILQLYLCQSAVIAQNRGCAQLLSPVQLFVIPWTVARQAPLSMGFPRQRYWSGLPFPSSGDLPDPGIESRSPALQADSLPAEPPGKSNQPQRAHLII